MNFYVRNNIYKDCQILKIILKDRHTYVGNPFKLIIHAIMVVIEF